MSETRKKLSSSDAAGPAERRRIGTVVHDERGNASVEWRAAPADEERPVLEVLSAEGLGVKTGEVSYDPYARNVPTRRSGARRTDLRKLSEWIKQMRELEARKRTEEDPDGVES